MCLPLEADGETWRFRHDKLREAIRDKLPHEIHHDLHHQAPLAMESIFPDVPDRAAAQFHLAFNIARKQKARSLELRAAMDLARLWVFGDKKQEAHQLLKEQYDWFTEGFDTADPLEAKALIKLLAN